MNTPTLQTVLRKIPHSSETSKEHDRKEFSTCFQAVTQEPFKCSIRQTKYLKHAYPAGYQRVLLSKSIKGQRRNRNKDLKRSSSDFEGLNIDTVNQQSFSVLSSKSKKHESKSLTKARSLSTLKFSQQNFRRAQASDIHAIKNKRFKVLLFPLQKEVTVCNLSDLLDKISQVTKRSVENPGVVCYLSNKGNWKLLENEADFTIATTTLTGKELIVGIES